MAKIIISKLADADVDIILEYLEHEAGIDTAIKYKALLQKLYNHLASFPKSCPSRPSIAKQIRIGIVSPYIVLYRYTLANDSITILRIVHGRRKITGKLLRGI